MKQSTVYFIDLRTTIENNLSAKLTRLFERAGLSKIIRPGDLTAVKLHFGEAGNTAFIRPIFIRDIVDSIYRLDAKPFLTDANTLYRGERSDAVSHITIALKHGFTYTTAGAPTIIADGLRGTETVTIPFSGTHFKQLSFAAAVVRADSIVNVSHFKGHELTGFGGALKNIGMGCASREGKMAQHATISPKVDSTLCVGCGRCGSICPAAAIKQQRRKARISPERCIGCAECITLCPKGAMKINWNDDTRLFQEKMIEYAAGLQQHKQGHLLHITFLMHISPSCDCYGHADRPIVPDIGILASRDPVAIDQASVDLVNAERACSESALVRHQRSGQDKFAGLYPNVDWRLQLNYAETLGIGLRSYKLMRV